MASDKHAARSAVTVLLVCALTVGCRSSIVRITQDSGRVMLRVSPDIAAMMVEEALALDLASLPTDLMGKAPWCRLVATDFPTITIELDAPDVAHRVRDYQGCFEQNDQSGSRVIRRLRAFEQAMLRLVTAG